MNFSCPDGGDLCEAVVDDERQALVRTGLSSKYLSTSARILIQTLCRCYLGYIIGVCGAIGNTFSIIVLKRQGIVDSTNLILMSLAIFDLTFLLMFMFRHWECLAAPFVDGAMKATLYAHQVSYLLLINMLIGQLSLMHVVVFAVVRLLAIFIPLKASVILSKRNTAIALYTTLFLRSLLSWPYQGMFKVKWVFDKTFNKTKGIFAFTQYFLDRRPIFARISLTYGMWDGPVSFAIILFCSVAISLKLKQVVRKRRLMMAAMEKQKGPVGDSEKLPAVEVKTIKLLLGVSAGYLCTSFPNMGPDILHFIRPDLDRSNLGSSLFAFVDLFLIMNSSINFIIYVTISPKFYNTYMELLQSWFGERTTKFFKRRAETENSALG